jgi:hypothetical protein
MTLSVRSLLLVAAPLSLGALLLFHPNGDSQTIYDGMHDQVTPWLVVHVGLAVGAVLMAVVLHQLLRGVSGRAATVGRYALAPFVVSFLAWEGFTGIQTGILADQANDLPAGAERAAAAADIQDHFTNPILGDPSVMSMLANGSWIVAVIAAGLALRRAYGGKATLILLCLAPLFTAHAIFLGPIGLTCLAAAALIVERKRNRMPAPRRPVADVRSMRRARSGAAIGPAGRPLG